MEEKTTTVTVKLSEVDMASAQRIRAFISKVHGPTSMSSVIRYALRKATKGLPK